MIRLLRMLRGAAGLSLVWGTVWGLGAAAWFGRTAESFFFIRYWVAYGAMSGLVFAALLVAARKHSLRALSTPRVAAWGVTAGVIVPVGLSLGALARNPEFFSEWNPARTLVSFAAFGAMCAVGSLILARRADTTSRGDGDPAIAELPDAHPVVTPANTKAETPRSSQALLLSNA